MPTRPAPVVVRLRGHRGGVDLVGAQVAAEWRSRERRDLRVDRPLIALDLARSSAKLQPLERPSAPLLQPLPYTAPRIPLGA